MLLANCTNTKMIRNDCRQTVVTYGDAVECMIALDNQLRYMY